MNISSCLKLLIDKNFPKSLGCFEDSCRFFSWNQLREPVRGDSVEFNYILKRSGVKQNHNQCKKQQFFHNIGFMIWLYVLSPQKRKTKELVNQSVKFII